MSGGTCRWFVAAVWCCLVAASAQAYVDLAPTLGRLILEAEAIAIVEVERFSSDKGLLILKPVRILKGKLSPDRIKHQVLRDGDSAVDRAIVDWAEPGQRGVLFASARSSLVCVGEGWYQVHSSGDGWWRLGTHRPDLPLAYYGRVSRLSEALTRILANKTAIITALPHGAEQQGASFDLALNRAGLPGLVKVQRLRAHLGMPTMAMAVGGNPAYLIGTAAAGREEIPRLREQLRAADATERAEGASDLGSLGPDAAVAVPQLVQLLSDRAPSVRYAAAAALLRIQPKDAKPLATLAAGLANQDPASRRTAVRATGFAGPAAAPLAAKLAGLLEDPAAHVRRAALQAIATLGPAAAAAMPAVAALLDEPALAIDAADTLGRIGPAARPALKSIARLLSADSAAQNWAAVRAMAQIGGNDAAPAVQFMIRELSHASQMDTYNMMIYLALLGPVARDAIPAIQRSRLLNPFLRQTTIWAIDPGTELPWLSPVLNNPAAQLVLESCVQELGEQLKPVAQTLAHKILAGKAGNVPAWGYKILAKHPDEALRVLTPALGDKDLVMRERAAVALGFMGRAAGSARAAVAQALAASPDERERLLLQWCLREIQ